MVAAWAVVHRPRHPRRGFRHRVKHRDITILKHLKRGVNERAAVCELITKRDSNVDGGSSEAVALPHFTHYDTHRSCDEQEYNRRNNLATNNQSEKDTTSAYRVISNHPVG